MKFPKLYIQNFLTIGKADLSLADKGLVLIQGDNQDDSSAVSNGAGKSSIVDALCWCLYGVTARGKTGDGVVNNKRKKDCLVQVTLVDGATTYHIERYRKHATFKNSLRVFADSGKADLTLGTDKETQALVEKIIGCSYDVFRAAVYSGQEQMPDLPGMTDKQLKVLIEEAAGVERIERAYELARAKAKEAETNLIVAANRVIDGKESILKSDERIGELTMAKETWETSRRERTDRANAELNAVAVKFKAKFEESRTFDEKWLTEEIAKGEAALTDWNEQQEKRKVLESSLNVRRSEESRLTIEANRYGDSVKRVKEEIAHTVDAKCASCGKPHSPEEVQKLLSLHTDRMITFKNGLKSTIDNRDRNRLEVERISAEIAAIDAQPKPEETLRVIAERRESLAKLGVIKNELRAIKADYDRAKAQIEAIAKEANPYDSLIAKETANKASLEAKLVELDKAGKEAGEVSHVLNDVVKVFGPAGVRAHILDTVTPFLNLRTAEYLSVLSDGNITATWTTLTKTAKGDLKEKFCIEVEHAKGGDDYAAISGGEKRKVRIATVLALQDLVAGRATKPIDLWVGDEVDDALDAAGLERFMAILEKRARERGTVLVVSHNELRDWIDNVLVVTKEPGGLSTVSGALCEA